MLHSSHPLTTFAFSGLCLLLASGCQAPGFERSNVKEFESARQPTAAATPKAKAMETVTAAADDATVATVMQEVREISAKDPAAGKLLVDELSRAEPKLWPLVVQQFRSRQAFHEQLLARPQPAPDTSAADVEDVVSMDPPSAEVGRLADPRGIRPDPAIEQAFARATPAHMPAPIGPSATEATRVAQSATPAAFADDTSARPLAALQPTANRDDGVVPASAVEASGVQQALYSADAVPAAKEPPPRDWQAHLDSAIDDLQQRLADGPQSTAEVHQVVSLRFLQLLAGETETALQPIPNVSVQEQDYWSSQIFTLATFLDHHRQPDDERRAAASVVHLDEAVGHLRELGSLSLRNLAFCKNVFGYGAYEPINNPTFTPGQKLTLYLEVENYHSESTSKGYTTMLGASYEVVNEAGERVAGGEFPNVEDCCQSRRRDFHIQYGLVLPKTVKSGKHHLKLVVDDRQSDKRGNASIAFEVR